MPKISVLQVYSVNICSSLKYFIKVQHYSNLNIKYFKNNIFIEVLINFLQIIQKFQAYLQISLDLVLFFLIFIVVVLLK